MSQVVYKTKVWGRTALVFRKAGVEIHRIEANAGGYCSRHSHQSKSNHFFVESGRLKVLMYLDGETVVSFLARNQGLDVPAGIEHRFVAEQDTVAYETYYATVDSEDIQRADTGGAEWQGEH